MPLYVRSTNELADESEALASPVFEICGKDETARIAAGEVGRRGSSAAQVTLKHKDFTGIGKVQVVARKLPYTYREAIQSECGMTGGVAGVDPCRVEAGRAPTPPAIHTRILYWSFRSCR